MLPTFIKEKSLGSKKSLLVEYFTKPLRGTEKVSVPSILSVPPLPRVLNDDKTPEKLK